MTSREKQEELLAELLPQEKSEVIPGTLWSMRLNEKIDELRKAMEGLGWLLQMHN